MNPSRSLRYLALLFGLICAPLFGNAALRLACEINGILLEPVRIARGEIFLNDNGREIPAQKNARWRLEGDLRENASLLALSPTYSIYAKRTLEGDDSRDHAKPFLGEITLRHSLTTTVADKPAESQFLEIFSDQVKGESLLLAVWMIGGKLHSVQALPLPASGAQAFSVSAQFHLTREEAAGQPVLLLWQPAGFATPVPRLEGELGSQAVIATIFDDAAALQALIARGLDVSKAKTKHGITLAHFAAEAGSMQALEVLLRKAPNLAKAVGENEMGAKTPVLLRAALNNRLEIVKRLLDAKADVQLPLQAYEEPETNILKETVSAGHLDVSGVLVARGAKIYAQDAFSTGPIDVAIANGDHEMVSVLLRDHKMDKKTLRQYQNGNILRFLLRGNRREMVDWFLKQNFKIGTPDMFAEIQEVMIGDSEPDQQINDSAAALGKMDNTTMAMQLASQGMSLPQGQPLVGSSIQTPSGGSTSTNSSSISFRHRYMPQTKRNIVGPDLYSNAVTPYAVFEASTQLRAVLAMMNRKADENFAKTIVESCSMLTSAALARQGARDLKDHVLRYDASPLAEACLADYTLLAGKFIDAGLKPGEKLFGGRTALHYAAAGNAKDSAQLLIKHGAAIGVTDDAGLSPLDVALACHSRETARLLASKGARINPLSKHVDTLANLAIMFDIPELVLPLAHARIATRKNLFDTWPLARVAEFHGATACLKALAGIPKHRDNNEKCTQPPPIVNTGDLDEKPGIVKRNVLRDGRNPLTYSRMQIVEINALLEPSGDVKICRPLLPDISPLLCRSAIDAVVRTKFSIPKAEGKPVAVWIVVPIEFPAHEAPMSAANLPEQIAFLSWPKAESFSPARKKYLSWNRAYNQEGLAHVAFVVDPKGYIKHNAVDVLRATSVELAEKTINSIQATKSTPATYDGRPVAYIMKHVQPFK